MPDGDKAAGVRFPPIAKASEDRTILGFGDNARTSEHIAAYLNELFPHPWSSPSTTASIARARGDPVRPGCSANARLAHDCAIGERDFAKVGVVIFSIAAGVAVYLARKRPLGGLILARCSIALSSWRTSITTGYLSGFCCGTAYLRSMRFAASRSPSRSSPPAMTLSSPRSKRRHTRRGYNDIYGNPEFVRAMHPAMKLIGKGARVNPAKQAPATFD